LGRKLDLFVIILRFCIAVEVELIFENMDINQLKTINNEGKNRFELWVDGHLGRIEYIINKTGLIFLTHTEVDRPLEGKGVAPKMVKDALQYIQAHDLKLVPLCPYVAGYLKRHPEYHSLLAKGYNI